MFRRFHRSERGIALVLTLVFLPVFIGVGLLVMDIGRGNNAQADHQAAADALALAGARELDGQDGAIQRARDAMEAITNDVSFLGLPGSDPIELVYSQDDAASPYTVIFLDAIPDDDDAALDQNWVSDHATGDDDKAKYVYVFSRADDLTTAFFIDRVTKAPETVPVAASAVATLKIRTCDLAPFFMCDPFAGTGRNLDTEFRNGGLYGRLLKLNIHNGLDKLTPGNIGFLEIEGSGATAVEEAMAGKPYGECVELSDSVKAEPGVKTPAWEGFNTRFDVYLDKMGTFGPNGDYRPSANVRKGYRGTGCNQDPPPDFATLNVNVHGKGRLTPAQLAAAEAAARNAELSRYFGLDPVSKGYTSTLTANAAPFVSDNAQVDPDVSFMGKGTWNFRSSVTIAGLTYPDYWKSAYTTDLTVSQLVGLSRHPLADDSITTEADIAAFAEETGSPLVSRYDIYRHEMALMATEDLRLRAAEKNNPSCSQPSAEDAIDRRTMLVAVIDCVKYPMVGSSGGPVPVENFAKTFLVRPHVKQDGTGSVKETMDIEVVDLVDPAGLGDSDEFLRAEALLVR